MSDDILKVLYHDFADMSFSSEGICPFTSEKWQEEEDAFKEFANRLSLSADDSVHLENNIIGGVMYKSGLEGFINGFKLAVCLFVGK